MQNQELISAVSAAALNGEATLAIRSIHAALQLEIDRRKPICVASGKCCNFEAYGHRLYVTTLELAVFSAEFASQQASQRIAQPSLRSGLPVLQEKVGARVYPPSDQTPPSSPGAPGAEVKSSIAIGGCPLQAGRLCGVHAIRPFGCRIFFCDPTATQWQQDQYEAFHARIKALHQRFSIPYFYVEWRAALAALGIAGL